MHKYQVLINRGQDVTIDIEANSVQYHPTHVVFVDCYGGTLYAMNSANVMSIQRMA